MIRLFKFWIKDLFTKYGSRERIHLVKKLDKHRYLCVIDSMVCTIRTDEYKDYLKNEL